MRKVWSEPFLLALPRSHPLAARANLDPEDLNGQDVIGFSMERGGLPFEVVQGYLNARGIRHNTLWAVSQSHTVMSLVNEGLGIVPRSNRMICGPDMVMADIAFPTD